MPPCHAGRPDASSSVATISLQTWALPASSPRDAHRTRSAGGRLVTSSDRMRRVNEAIKQIVSETIPTLKDPRIGFVTVTGVETTSDLDQATVWLSIYGPERERQGALDALEGASGLFQGRINRELHIRKTPKLVFKYDAAVERGVRMTQLIDELAPADPDVADDDPGS